MNGKPDNYGLKRQLGFLSATIVVIANMIGTGIFTTSGFIIENLGSPQTMLFCWLVGGLFALCGALCYGELGARFPKAGGEYVYLRESLGKCMGFLSGWISLIVGFSAPVAAASIAFSTYSWSALSLPSDLGVSLTIYGIEILTLSPVTLLSIATIAILSLVHIRGLIVGSRVQNILTLLKLCIIGAFIVARFWFGNGSMENFVPGFQIGDLFKDKFAVSLIFVSFAYCGWNGATYIGSEIRNPDRNIPLSLISGTCVVMVIYLLLNIVYIYALPAKEMAGVLEVGSKSAAFLFGVTASKYFGGAIAIGLLSVISAMIMTGPRIYYAMAKDGVFFGAFSRISTAHGTPARSIVLQAIIAILMATSASFDKLLIYIGFTLSLFAMLTVLGLIVIRLKRPDIISPYKTLGYPITSLLFVLGNMWIIYFSIKSTPIAPVCGLVTIGLGVCFYFLFAKKITKGGRNGKD